MCRGASAVSGVTCVCHMLFCLFICTAIQVNWSAPHSSGHSNRTGVEWNRPHPDNTNNIEIVFVGEPFIATCGPLVLRQPFECGNLFAHCRHCYFWLLVSALMIDCFSHLHSFVYFCLHWHIHSDVSEQSHIAAMYVCAASGASLQKWAPVTHYSSLPNK